MSFETTPGTTTEIKDSNNVDGFKLARNISLGTGALFAAMSFESIDNGATEIKTGLTLLAIGGILEAVRRIKNAK